MRTIDSFIEANIKRQPLRYELWSVGNHDYKTLRNDKEWICVSNIQTEEQALLEHKVYTRYYSKERFEVREIYE